MLKFTGNELEIRIDPELEGEQQIHVLIIHDETTFQSNDGKPEMDIQKTRLYCISTKCTICFFCEQKYNSCEFD